MAGEDIVAYAYDGFRNNFIKSDEVLTLYRKVTNTMSKIIGYFALFEILGLLGFIVVSRYQEGMVVRFVPFLLAIVAVVFFAFLKANAFSYKEIANISVVTSVMFILVFQFLGFTICPGLAKGIDYLSAENLARTGVMLFVGITCHFLLLSLARIGRM